jgi:type III secretory pathway component EscR
MKENEEEEILGIAKKEKEEDKAKGKSNRKRSRSRKKKKKNSYQKSLEEQVKAHEGYKDDKQKHKQTSRQEFFEQSEKEGKLEEQE